MVNPTAVVALSLMSFLHHC